MPNSPDRRHRQRQRVLKSGAVQFYHSPTTFDCAIRNLTDGGARLMFDRPVSVELVFRLLLADGQVHHCRAIWIDRNEVGVEFISQPLAA